MADGQRPPCSPRAEPPRYLLGSSADCRWDLLLTVPVPGDWKHWHCWASCWLVAGCVAADGSLVWHYGCWIVHASLACVDDDAGTVELLLCLIAVLRTCAGFGAGRTEALSCPAAAPLVLVPPYQHARKGGRLETHPSIETLITAQDIARM
jgi:hypothetical protein